MGLEDYPVPVYPVPVPVVSLESNLTWKATKVLKFHFFWNRKFELTCSAKFNLYNTPVKVIK